MPTYACFEDEATGCRFIFELELGTTPLHLVDGDTEYERVGLVYEAATLAEAVADPHTFC